MQRFARQVWTLCAGALLVAGCGGGGSGGSSPPALPDLAGFWAGTWTGFEPGLGTVTGTWQAQLVQSGNAVTGSGSLRGDIDCMDGILAGQVDASNQLGGTFTRTPCQANQWLLTALDVAGDAAAGTWTQIGSGSQGTLTGTRIATSGGPRIAFMHPSGGLAGTWVTVAGANFAPVLGNNTLRFNSAASVLDHGDTTTLVTRVPVAASDGPLSLDAAAQHASSPLAFNTGVTHPGAIVTAAVSVDALPQGVVLSPDGRKVYSANRGSASVSVVNTANNLKLFSPPVAANGGALAASPDGRHIYASSGSSGVLVLDAATATTLDSIALADAGGPIAIGLGADPIPNGLALRA